MWYNNTTMKISSELADLKLQDQSSGCKIYLDPVMQEQIAPDNDIVLTIKIFRNSKIVFETGNMFESFIEKLKTEQRDIFRNTAKPHKAILTTCLPEGETIESARKKGLLNKAVSAPCINQTDQIFNFKNWIVGSLPNIFDTN